MRTHVYLYLYVYIYIYYSTFPQLQVKSKKKVLSSEAMSNKARQLELDTHSDFYLVIATLAMSIGKNICSYLQLNAFESSQSREEISR